MNKSETISQRTNLKWIKAESGTTYLCPIQALDQLSDLSEKHLRTFCVDESQNPHND